MSTQTPAGVTGVEHRLGPLAEIPVGEGRCYAVDGQQVAVFRLRSGEVHATQATCPHRGGPLADGQLDDRVVVCPLHAFAFVLTTGRRVGDEDGRPPAGLLVHHARVDDAGTVVVTLAG